MELNASGAGRKLSLRVVEKWHCVVFIPIGSHWRIQQALSYKIASWEGISGDGEVEREGQHSWELDEEVCSGNWFDHLTLSDVYSGSLLGDYDGRCLDNRIQRATARFATQRQKYPVTIKIKTIPTVECSNYPYGVFLISLNRYHHPSRPWSYVSLLPLMKPLTTCCLKCRKSWIYILT